VTSINTWSREFAAGIGTLTLLALFACSSGDASKDPETVSPISAGCPGIDVNSDYLSSESFSFTAPSAEFDNRLDLGVFTAREAEIFREVAFSGAEIGSRDRVAHKRLKPVTVFEIGPVRAVEKSLEVLRVVSDLTGLQIKFTGDPSEADLVLCLGLTYQEHRDNLLASGLPELLVGLYGSGFALVRTKDSIEITSGFVTTPRSLSNGANISVQDIEKIIAEEIVQSFGLLNDFALSRYEDVPSARQSLFITDDRRLSGTIGL
jgi:hypothetical protein